MIAKNTLMLCPACVMVGTVNGSLTLTADDQEKWTHAPAADVCPGGKKGQPRLARDGSMESVLELGRQEARHWPGNPSYVTMGIA